MTTGVDINIGLLDDNDALASENRARLDRAGARCVNLMSSPGSGKTTLLEATVTALNGDLRLAVIEGDMTTELDADRLRARGVPVAAITTGRSCHLEADQVADGLDRLGSLDGFDLVVIENVGNLICPAAYELGEHARVVLVAVTEGEDKPLKYPIMFHGADCVVVTKLDLAPYLKLDIERLKANIHEVNPRAAVLALSAETGAGMTDWLDWLRGQAPTSRPA